MRQLVYPENDEDRISRQLIEAALSGDEQAVLEALEHELVDVNYRGTVSLRVKYTDSIQREEVADEVKFDYQEFRTDVTPLFAAAHLGHIGITKKLLTVGADVNQKLFRGFATTAASREGHHQVLDLLLRAGAQQEAVEDALLEACLYGHVKAAELLIGSEMTRPDVLAQALVHASSRGFVDVVATLIKSGVDIDSWHRVLLRSAKPMLYANIDCTPLIAAIVGRQTAVVDYLLQAGAKTGCKASLGAWSWDSGSGEELRVGAGLGEPYNEAWCAVEYWESSGHILTSLLKHLSPDSVHNGRTLICHAILCRNMPAMQLILDAGADAEFLMQARDGQERPLHYAARSGWLPAVKVLIDHVCSVDAITESKDSALMICAKHKYWDCFEELLAAGADLGIQNSSGQSAITIAEGNGYGSGVQKIIWNAIVKGSKVRSTDPEVFSALHVAAKAGDLQVLQKLLEQGDIDVNVQDKYGYTAAMLAVGEGHLEAFKLLLYAGADIGMKSKKGETAVALARNGTLERLEWILLDAILANVLKSDEFQVLHFAARRGHLEVLTQLVKRGCAVNGLDEDGYTPLMLSAREGHADAVKLLLLAGADTSLTNGRGETALSLAQKHSASKAAENIILDYLAKKFVLAGGQVSKHTRQGKGKPHMKNLSMLKSGVLCWGRSRRRNVICREAALGPSEKLQRNRRRRGDADKPGVFRIVTNKGREVHFEASSQSNAELWVRGINLLSAEVRVPNGSDRGPGAGA
ncbi:uncharacterized protein MPTK1_2g25620 [Marchantia polymorpha subsp. ruderalis]|uniref:PH domain-containing protein n=2 Tax=Marchantia polymorpha TaxID=3197 RepID=A0A176VD23_MARPO|nr:hypothetical protein AXG93_4448s1250 [Marchantia polymorpha subsp. ruderalis]PTQ43434.1 hypothetical protein MARPO_0025s0116 [Marchantia polymorpha]BBN03698.1 hypothetical protein Mp_2g25620 [Marchantia polymorpha subsp. ruderalis]|eukprot:PTQ43434.1 hypothetical protein MARPO_0025s0116 [Marchantia polymorpha]